MSRFAAVLLLATLAACTDAPPAAYQREALAGPGSPFHGVHGLRFGPDGLLYATSVIGQSVFRVDTQTGEIARVVAPPEGMGDDLDFAADGTLYWTAIEDGIIYAQSPGGPIRRVVENRKGVNAISFSPQRDRLFFSLVFYGDALYELDQTGAMPPRLVADSLGGLNAFQVGADGMIYGPLMFGARVVRIDPDSGAVETLSTEFESPGALKLDFRGSAYVLDGAQLKRLDLETRAITGTLQLPADADNLAIDRDGRVFVSMAAPNAIAEANVDTGTVRYVLGPSTLNSPTGLAVSTENGADKVYVGDLFGGIKRLDGATGALEPTGAVDLFQPAHVSIRGNTLLTASQVFGAVQRLDRRTFAVLGSWDGFSSPGDALEMADGSIVVADTGTGRIVHVTGPTPTERSVLVDGLAAPTGLALAPDGTLYVTDTAAGRVLRVPPGEGASVIAEDLEQPEGIALDAEGRIFVLEVAARRVVRIDISGPVAVAADLPVGLSVGPSLYRGLAAGGSALYFSSDIDNVVYRLTSAPP
jgi:sugar lactone lactonase YvrE